MIVRSDAPQWPHGMAVVEIPQETRGPTDLGFEEKTLPRQPPLILKGFAAQWPARTKWSLDYLEKVCGDAMVMAAIMEKNRFATDPISGLRYLQLPLREVMRWWREPKNKAGDGLYLATPLESLSEVLRADLTPPEFCRKALWARCKIWLGSEGMTSPLHRDIPHNFYVQLQGRKRFILFAPGQGRYLYPHSLLSRTPNLSRASADAPDFERFPRLRESTAWVGVLEAGDALFFPSLWWHQTRALSQSLSVNFWWARGFRALLAAGSELAKRLLGVSR